MDYKKKYKTLKLHVELLKDQLDEKRAEQQSLANASEEWDDTLYHKSKQEAFSESVEDVVKILNEED